MNLNLIKITLLNILCLMLCSGFAQKPKRVNCNIWQSLHYKMNISFNEKENKFTGYQKVVYKNTSPDTLQQLFYHLFYNAFQPGSGMQERAMHIRDQGSYAFTIRDLKPNEIGYHHIDSIKIGGQVQPYVINRTILKINPLKSIGPNDSVNIEIWFNSQVPKMIIRSGRDNPEHVDYTMTQWYPKVAAYDRAGWHTEQYIQREFYGPFADFDVRIKIDKKYTLAATGVLDTSVDPALDFRDSNTALLKNNTEDTVWHFKAMRVHDFAWAADTAYVHIKTSIRKGLQLNLFYKPATATVEDWKDMANDVEGVFNWMEHKVGPYPYPQYSLVQGGTGGTEYPMLSMILGHRPKTTGMSKFYPVFTIALHEIMHNWWYAVVANDENRNPWLDEGFALFFQYEYEDYLKGSAFKEKAIQESYEQLLPPAKLNDLEPMTTPSDYYDANWGYTSSAYHKGAIFLNQLRYIIGEDLFWKGIQKYFADWSFAHPDGDDFIHCMEQASGIQLKWYLDLWTKTTKHIDYAVGEVENTGKGTEINLLQKGDMPMPIDLRIQLKNDSLINYTIPLVEMNGAKKKDGVIVANAWSWTNPVYTLNIPVPYNEIKSVQIDPEHELFDLDRNNNQLIINYTKK